ncbi:MAG: hypothetical protein AB1633_07030, partial [Elusimicrobiota bacterium]
MVKILFYCRNRPLGLLNLLKFFNRFYILLTTGLKTCFYINLLFLFPVDVFSFQVVKLQMHGSKKFIEAVDGRILVKFHKKVSKDKKNLIHK